MSGGEKIRQAILAARVSGYHALATAAQNELAALLQPRDDDFVFEASELLTYALSLGYVDAEAARTALRLARDLAAQRGDIES